MSQITFGEFSSKVGSPDCSFSGAASTTATEFMSANRRFSSRSNYNARNFWDFKGWYFKSNLAYFSHLFLSLNCLFKSLNVQSDLLCISAMILNQLIHLPFFLLILSDHHEQTFLSSEMSNNTTQFAFRFGKRIKLSLVVILLYTGNTVRHCDGPWHHQGARCRHQKCWPADLTTETAIEPCITIKLVRAAE